MKSCICFKERDDNEGRFSTVAIQSLLWALYYLTNCACHDFNVRLKLCAIIKFRAKLKAA